MTTDGPPAVQRDHPTQGAPSDRTGELLRLAWPLMLSNLAYTAVGFTDTLYMGRLGVTEVGAVGLASLCVFALTLLFRCSLNTAATFVARTFGAADRPGIRRWAGLFLTLSLVGVPLGLCGPWLADGALTLLGPAPDIARVARVYARIRMLETPLMLLGAASLAIMLGLGNMRTPMVLSWMVMVVNAALAALSVFGFGWGVAGAAWAGVVAVGLQGLLAFTLLLRQYSPLYGRVWFLRPKGRELRAVARVSWVWRVTAGGKVAGCRVTTSCLVTASR